MEATTTYTSSMFDIIFQLLFYFPDKLKKHEIEMKPNQAYETVTRPRPATQVHTKPCPAYGVVVHTHH